MSPGREQQIAQESRRQGYRSSRVVMSGGECREGKELLEEISTMTRVVTDDFREGKERRGLDNEFQSRNIFLSGGCVNMKLGLMFLVFLGAFLR